ncbi:DUF1788 domain-containing protein [Sporolactobacillus spathodeae]|nr:DUF1788 domain-containing protein [Sporolactobacillus spathodeae]
MRTLQERLDDLLPKIQSADFLKGHGLTNQANYYIFSYDPKDEMMVREHVRYLVDRINDDPATARHVVEFDLYEMMLKILKEKGYLDKNFAMEEKYGSGRILEATRRTLRLTQDDDQVIKYIREHVSPGEIILITGVGKAFPIIRSHEILNNIFKASDNSPVILFFPGSYTGQELVLFNTVKDDNYYRAVPIVQD